MLFIQYPIVRRISKAKINITVHIAEIIGLTPLKSLSLLVCRLKKSLSFNQHNMNKLLKRSFAVATIEAVKGGQMAMKCMRGSYLAIVSSLTLYLITSK